MKKRAIRSGGFAGGSYPAYRYGERNPRPVYIPGSRPILTPASKLDAIDKVVGVMSTWTLTKFEYEADCRHGVRVAFIEDGFAWQRSDDEAARIVAGALAKMQARRPTWEEGQREYTTPRENCAWCAREIDREDASRGQRFCSPQCAKLALEHRDYDGGHRHAVAQSAYILIKRKNRPPRQCKCCGREFQPRRKDAVYCSPRCSRSAKGDFLEDRACLTCGTIFHPKDGRMLYCSQSCGMKGTIAKRHSSLPPRRCDCCGEQFQPKMTFEVYCGTRCQNSMRSRSYRARQKGLAGILSPIIVDREIFDQLILPLTPGAFDELVAA